MKALDIFNTQWLTDDYVDDIRYLNERVFGGLPVNHNMYDRSLYEAIMQSLELGEVHIDFAGVQMSTKVWTEFDSLYRNHKDRVFYEDTKDPDRNKFLYTFMESFNNDFGELAELPEKPSKIQQLPKYVNDLKTNVVYDCTGYDKHPEFIAIIQLMRPDIKMKCMHRSLFNYIHEKFLMYLMYDETEFKYITSHGDYFWTTSVDSDNRVRLLNIGVMQKEDFVQKYVCVPKWFGERRHDKLHATKYEKQAVENISKDVLAFLAERPLTIKAIFEEG